MANSRGYFQKSFVILSTLPFHNFFYELVSRWAPHYFQEGKSSLISGWTSVLGEWPPVISPNSNYQLPIFGYVYQIFIPAECVALNKANQNNSPQTVQSIIKEDTTNNNNINNRIPITLTSVNEIDIFGAIHAVIHHIHLIFELVLLGEPILVIAQSPTDASLLVQALTSMISPLEYFPEYFPYFTIHNQEFHEFANASKPASVILGEYSSNQYP
jgi:hypothetical protein